MKPLLLLIGWLPMMGAALVSAPVQCAREPDPELEGRDTAEQALYHLAQRFKQEGDQSAWRRTLEYLIQRYPNSHHAVQAKAELGASESGPSGSRSDD